MSSRIRNECFETFEDNLVKSDIGKLQYRQTNVELQKLLAPPSWNGSDCNSTIVKRCEALER